MSGFESMRVILEGDGALEDVDPEKIVAGKITRAIYLTSGTTAGNPSVSIVIELEDGTHVLGETTLALFLSAARAFKGRQEYEAELQKTQM